MILYTSSIISSHMRIVYYLSPKMLAYLTELYFLWPIWPKFIYFYYCTHDIYIFCNILFICSRVPQKRYLIKMSTHLLCLVNSQQRLLNVRVNLIKLG